MRTIVRCLLACIFIIIGAVQIDASEKGNVYHHPTGLTFWYPQSWRLQELDEALQLVPNDVVTAQKGPSEIYFVGGESIAGSGISHANDPQVVSYVDQQVRSVLHQLQLSRE